MAYTKHNFVDGEILYADSLNDIEDELVLLEQTTINIDNKVNISDIVDNLTSTDTNKPLSANQGKVLDNKVQELNENKVNISDIKDNLTSTDTNKPLSANQGKVLDNKIQELNEKLAETIFKINDGENTIDADGGSIRGIKLYGRCLQDGIPTPDNPIEIQSVVNPKLSVSNNDGSQVQEATLPYTLNAIPVSSGGNVTIDGQQYIADYVDIENKKLVRMVDESKLDATVSIIDNTSLLLETPTITELTDDEIQAFKTLHTYEGVTNILDSSDQISGSHKFIYNITGAIDDLYAQNWEQDKKFKNYYNKTEVNDLLDNIDITGMVKQEEGGTEEGVVTPTNADTLGGKLTANNVVFYEEEITNEVGQVVLRNADLLDNHPASYFATSEDLNTAIANSGKFYGIDTSKVLANQNISTTATYTATEDCYLYYSMIINAFDNAIKIDGVEVIKNWSNANVSSVGIIPLKKGQVVSTRNNNTCSIIAYGIKEA